MKLRLSGRTSDRIGWIVAAALFAALFAPVVYYIVPFIGFVAVEQYSGRLRGYGTLTCTVHTIGDTLSPSVRWTARIERGEGCDGSPDPWIDVVLIPNDRPRFLARHKWVFYRDFAGQRPGGDRMAVKWISDSALEVNTPPCEPPCQKLDDQTGLLAPTGASPCDASCRSEKRVASVNVAIKPPAS